MMGKLKDFVSEQGQVLSAQASKLGKEPVETAREAALKSAAGIKSMKDPVRTLAHSGVKLTAISQSTAQSLIELQAEMVTSALTEAATRLERAARTNNVLDLVRDQAEVLAATRGRILSDISQAVEIFKTAGGDVRKVATQTYASVSSKAPGKPKGRKTAGKAASKRAPAVKKAKRKVRKTRTSARKK